MIVALTLMVSGCEQNKTEVAGVKPAAAPTIAVPAPAASTPATWDRDLLTLLPMIDACIARAPESRVVSYAGERDGATFVRLMGAEQALDCRVSASGAGAEMVVQVAPREESLVIEGERAALFARGPGENPGGECYEAPDVRDASGALVGWMIDPDGC